MRAAYVLLVLGFLLLSPKLAWAVPAPMSPAELLAASDLVALVREACRIYSLPAGRAYSL
jgi:hypothetical protein